MSFVAKNIRVPAKRGKLTISTHDLAIWSIVVYIICSIVFEFTAISITALASISLYLCLGCCMLDCICNKKIRFHWTIGTLLVFGVLIWISLYYTPASTTYTESRMYRYWTSLVLMFLIICVKPNTDDIIKFINAFVIAGAVLALYIYFFYGLDVLANSETRLQNGDFGNVNVVGLHCAFSAMLAIYLMVAQKKSKLYCLIAFAICLPCIMFSGSRKALLTLIICLLAFVFLHSKNVMLIKRILLAGLILLGIVIILNVIPAFAPIKERLLGLFDLFGGEDASVVGDKNRMLYLAGGFQAFLEKPIFGHGFCYSYHIFGAYSHNNFVEILMCHGIVGFLIYYFVFVRMMHDCYRSRIDHRLKVFVYLVLLKMLLEDVGSVTYYNRATFLMLSILACCISATIEQPRKLQRAVF